MHALAITEQGITVRAEGDMLLLSRGKHTVKQVRVREIDQVLLFGRIELTSSALALLLRRGVDVVLLTRQAIFRGRLVGRASKNVALRLAQYRQSQDAEFVLQMARSVVAGKIRHQRQILLRAQRRVQDDEMADAIGGMRVLAERAMVAERLDVVRGLEGQSAALYFGQFGKLIRNAEFDFSGRNRQPPRDPVNALLSFGYAVVGSLLETDVYRCGLDPLLGFLHEPAYGRSSLMLDLLEEFRPLVDSLVLRLVNRRQLGAQDFERRTHANVADVLQAPEREDGGDNADADAWGDSDATLYDGTLGAGSDGPDVALPQVPSPPEPVVGVYLTDMGRRVFLSELFRRLRETVYYPPRQAAFEIRDIFREQIYHLARVIDGRESSYQSFVPQ